MALEMSLSGLFGGIPATGAPARTVTNIQSGGKTPVGSAMHALFILFYVLCFSSYISKVPMASLAAFLLLMAYRMFHWQQFINIIRIGPLEDAIVLVVCFGFTVIIDMIAGVTSGVVMACFLLVRRISNMTQLQVSHHKSKPYKINNRSIPHDTIVYHIIGSLLFCNVEQVLDQIETTSQAKIFIIDLEDVPVLDMTSTVALKRIALDISKNRKYIVLCARKSLADRIKAKLKKVPNNFVHIKHNLREAIKLSKTF